MSLNFNWVEEKINICSLIFHLIGTIFHIMVLAVFLVNYTFRRHCVISNVLRLYRDLLPTNCKNNKKCIWTKKKMNQDFKGVVLSQCKCLSPDISHLCAHPGYGIWTINETKIECFRMCLQRWKLFDIVRFTQLTILS